MTKYDTVGIKMRFVSFFVTLTPLCGKVHYTTQAFLSFNDSNIAKDVPVMITNDVGKVQTDSFVVYCTQIK